MDEQAEDDALLRQQVEYYRHRAGEYDQWFLRQGRYDRGPELNSAWHGECGALAAALAAFSPRGRVLELACGTGLWTERLVPYAESITAVDASPEVLAINRARIGDGRVRHVEADLFDWQPDDAYDVVFFSFWLSHVPPDRFTAFWEMVRSALSPGGRVFFVDSLYERTSTAVDHELAGQESTTVVRRLNDGREFRIVKVFHQPEELRQRLAKLGWRVTVQSTGRYFLYGYGGVSESAPRERVEA